MMRRFEGTIGESPQRLARQDLVWYACTADGIHMSSDDISSL